jgi:hypothetical protein
MKLLNLLTKNIILGHLYVGANKFFEKTFFGCMMNHFGSIFRLSVREPKPREWGEPLQPLVFSVRVSGGDGEIRKYCE